MIELLFVLMMLGLWLLPTVVAGARGMPNVGSVAVIDVLLGWTIIGWVVALAMACGAKPQRVAYWSASPGGPPGASIPRGEDT